MTDQTAMMLTQEEWDDLEAIVAHYRASTAWVACESQPVVERRRALAQRIIEANH